MSICSVIFLTAVYILIELIESLMEFKIKSITPWNLKYNLTYNFNEYFLYDIIFIFNYLFLFFRKLKIAFKKINVLNAIAYNFYIYA